MQIHGIRLSFVWLALVLCVTTFASAQGTWTESADNNDSYIGLLFGGNLGGSISGGSIQATQGGTTSSASISGLTPAKGFAAGGEAGWYKDSGNSAGIGVEDLVVTGGLASSNISLAGTTFGLDKFNATQNFLLVNGLLRFLAQKPRWGIWYPCIGAGFGFVSGSISNATTNASGYSLNSKPAGDFRIGVAATRDSGLGFSAEYQVLISGFSMILPTTTSSYAPPISGSLSGTAINSVLDVGLSYHFHL